MPRPQPTDSGRSWIVRVILGVYAFLASLKLAVILIFSLAVVLGVATFVEANYGTAAVGFLIYHTVWFAALLALLAANIFCAAAIRFPWKRHQTGFVVTHIGLLTLLAGSAITARGSLNSQLLVFLNDSGQVAIDQDQSVITVYDLPGRAEPLTVRFAPGPFNWSDLAPYGITRRVKSWVGADDPSKTWVHPPRVLYESDDVRLELVDYLSRSEVHQTPYLGLSFYQPVLKFEIPIDLEFEPGLPMAQANFPEFLGVGAEVVGWKARSADDLRAFKECTPNETVTGDGTVALWAAGEVHSLSVDALRKMKADGKPYVVDDRLSVELVAYAEQADIRALTSGKGLVSTEAPRGNGAGPAVELLVREKTGEKTTEHRILRFAQLPFLPNRTQPDQFAVELYHPKMAPRVEILIAPGERFAYRAWQQSAKRVVASGDLAVDEMVDTWSMGGGSNVMKMTLKRYIEEGEGGRNFVVLPLPFDKADRGESKRIKLRLRWKEAGSNNWREDAFWLKQNLPPPWESARGAQVHETDIGRDKTVRTTYNVKETDIGFAFQLFDFDLEVDPGTKTAANYTSHLVQIDVRDEPAVKELRDKLDRADDPHEKQRLREEIASTSRRLIDEHLEKLKKADPDERQALIDASDSLAAHVVTMNEPLDYPDLSGRPLRFFQENYLPPEQTGLPPGSIFRVNYDPGRPVKYLGSGLIVFGIFLMFYMRAYFFKKPAQGVV